MLIIKNIWANSLGFQGNVLIILQMSVQNKEIN